MTPIAIRVQKRRADLRRAGLRPIQIWVPDTRAAGFAEECRRQAARVAEADAHDTALAHFMEIAVADLEGWSA